MQQWHTLLISLGRLQVQWPSTAGIFPVPPDLFGDEQVIAVDDLVVRALAEGLFDGGRF